jgi:hypothetical protein
MNDGINANQTNGNNEGCSGAIIGWGILAFVISTVVGFMLLPRDPGFWVRSALVVASIIGGTPCGTAGALIGDYLRKIARPDAIFTSGGMSEILKQKIFWAVGPQFIGTCVGAAIGIELTGGLLSTYVFR